jgi:hypothetical protein
MITCAVLARQITFRRPVHQANPFASVRLQPLGPLFALFLSPLPVIISNLQPLFAKYRGWGGCGPNLKFALRVRLALTPLESAFAPFRPLSPLESAFTQNTGCAGTPAQSPRGNQQLTSSCLPTCLHRSYPFASSTAIDAPSGDHQDVNVARPSCSCQNRDAKTSRRACRDGNVVP